MPSGTLLTNVGVTDEDQYGDVRMLGQTNPQGNAPVYNYEGGDYTGESKVDTGMPMNAVPVQGGWISRPQNSELGKTRQEMYDRLVYELGYDPMTIDPYNDAVSKTREAYELRYGSGYMSIPEYRRGYELDLKDQIESLSSKQKVGMERIAKRLGFWDKDVAATLPKPVTLAEGGIIVDERTGRVIAANPKAQTLAPGHTLISKGGAFTAPETTKLGPGEVAYGPRGMMQNPNRSIAEQMQILEYGAKRQKEHREETDNEDQNTQLNQWAGSVQATSDGSVGKLTADTLAAHLPPELRVFYTNYRGYYNDYRSKNPGAPAKLVNDWAMVEAGKRDIEKKVLSLSKKGDRDVAAAKLPDWQRGLYLQMLEENGLTDSEKKPKKKPKGEIFRPTYQDSSADWAY